MYFWCVHGIGWGRGASSTSSCSAIFIPFLSFPDWVRSTDSLLLWGDRKGWNSRRKTKTAEVNTSKSVKLCWVLGILGSWLYDFIVYWKRQIISFKNTPKQVLWEYWLGGSWPGAFSWDPWNLEHWKPHWWDPISNPNLALGVRL